MDIEEYKKEYEMSWRDEDMNAVLKQGEAVYTAKGIFQAGDIEFEKFPEFNAGFEIVQRMDKHIFNMGLKDQSQENLEKLFPQVKAIGGDFILDLTYGTNKPVLLLADIGGLGEMFLNYIKLYKLLKGLKHHYTKRFYRVLHPGIVSLTDEQVQEINKELLKLRAKINEHREVVITQPENWDALVIPGVKYCFAKVLEENVPSIEDYIKFGEIPSEAHLNETVEYELAYAYTRRGELEGEEPESEKAPEPEEPPKAKAKPKSKAKGKGKAKGK